MQISLAQKLHSPVALWHGKLNNLNWNHGAEEDWEWNGNAIILPSQEEEEKTFSQAQVGLTSQHRGKREIYILSLKVMAPQFIMGGEAMAWEEDSWSGAAPQDF